MLLLLIMMEMTMEEVIRAGSQEINIKEEDMIERFPNILNSSLYAIFLYN